MIHPENWKPVGGLILEPNALTAATEKETSLALTAGPGAGKTEMLAQRADFLLQTGTSPYPKRILAISFKVDASKNLKARVQKRCGHEMASRLDSYTFHGFAKRLIDIFRPVLTGLDALDPGFTVGDVRIDRKQITFDDMIPMAIEILSRSDVARNALLQTYSDVFLDEFQDCTGNQYKLVKLAFLGTGIRMVAVGDTKQRIMNWAGALEGVFGQYADDFNAAPLNLFRNFRSKGMLLKLQNEIIKTLDPASVMADELIPDTGGSIEIHHFYSEEEESDYIVQTISAWLEQGIPISEIAVLVRSQVAAYLESLTQKLDKEGISYRNEQDFQDLASEPIVELVTDYLLVLFGDREPEAWTRLMEKLQILSDVIGTKGTADDLINFVEQACRKVSLDKPRYASLDAKWDLVAKFMTTIGPSRLPHLSTDYENQDRLAELLEDTKAALEESLAVDRQTTKALKRLSEVQAVRLLTVHKSKGLEFESVVLLGVEKDSYFGSIDESRCTYFVGVSRAKTNLILTHCDYRSTPKTPVKYWPNNRTEQKEFLDYARQVIL